MKLIQRFKALGAYSGAAYIGQLCNVLINAAFIRSLSAGTLGDIAIAKIWMQMLDYSHLGFRFALDRFGPVWPNQRSKILLSICIATTSVVSFVLALIALAITSNVVLTLCFLVGGYSVALATILKNHFRALGQTVDMLGTYLICPTAPLLVQTFAILVFDFNAFLVAGTLSYIGAGAYLLIKFKPMAKSNIASIKRVIHLAAPTSFILLISASVGFISFSLDKVLLLHYTNKSVLGEYSVILFSFTLIILIPNIISEFIFPGIIRDAVKSNKLFFPKESLYVLAPTILAAVAVYFSIPVVIVVFPIYEHLAPQLQIVLWGVPPYAALPILFHTMSAHNMKRQLLLASLLALTIFTLLLIYIGHHLNGGLNEFVKARIGFGYVLFILYAFFLISKGDTISFGDKN